MDGKTHAAVGAAGALLFIGGATVPEVTVTLGAGILGALTPDIDVGTSKSSRIVKTLCTAILGTMFVGIATKLITGINLFAYLGIQNIFANVSILSLLGLVDLFVCCIMGLKTSHRGFTHSIVALFLFTIGIYMVSAKLAPAFFVGMLSHLLIDVLNTKGCQYLWPLKSRWCLKLCKANGVVARSIRLIALAICAIELGVWYI